MLEVCLWRPNDSYINPSGSDDGSRKINKRLLQFIFIENVFPLIILFLN